jgi:cyclic pyranopterin phosphate synthase
MTRAARARGARALTHLDARGHARMVDISGKDVTVRTAIARGRVRLDAASAAALASGRAPKGDVLAVARLAGIQAAKRAAELIPLCHPLPIDAVALELSQSAHGVEIRATVRTTGRTGVEMEALTAVAVAALTVYDMLKAVSHDLVIEGIELVEKRGGRSGAIVRARAKP